MSARSAAREAAELATGDGDVVHGDVDGDDERRTDWEAACSGCMCEWEAGCSGTGVLHCRGCGGDLCVCVCGGETECEGCEWCDGGDSW